MNEPISKEIILLQTVEMMLDWRALGLISQEEFKKFMQSTQNQINAWNKESE